MLLHASESPAGPALCLGTPSHSEEGPLVTACCLDCLLCVGNVPVKSVSRSLRLPQLGELDRRVHVSPAEGRLRSQSNWKRFAIHDSIRDAAIVYLLPLIGTSLKGLDGRPASRNPLVQNAFASIVPLDRVAYCRRL